MTSAVAQGSVVSPSQAQFLYTDYPLNHSLGLPFNYSGSLEVIVAPGQKGILLLWFEKNLLISKNVGKWGLGSGPPLSAPPPARGEESAGRYCSSPRT